MALTQSHTRRVLLVLAVFLLLLAAAARTLAVSLQDEIDLGKKLDVEILKQTPLCNDDDAQKQMTEYGQKLAKNVRRPEIKYHFKVLSEDDLNAFSTPGGYVYFSEKLWNVLNKDERIGVIAHEIVHVDRRHALDAISKQQRRRLWLTVLLVGVGANQTVGGLASLAESMYTLKYSRADEQQADEVGVELTQKAGYNPAGLLLAMRKIKRFEDERGGTQPKIFSSHPPTKERLDYLEAMLQKKGVTVPGAQVKDIANPYKIGVVTAVNGETIEFTSSKALQPGDVVWAMAFGWDYKYENKTAVPIARAVVKSAGTTYSARVWTMSTAKDGELKKGINIYGPPDPQPPVSIGTIEPIAGQESTIGRLHADKPLGKFDRLLAVNPVWDREYTKLVNSAVGYLVIRNPDSPTGYVSASRYKFSYAPMSSGAALVPAKDPDQARWVGPIVSIGRGGETLEVLPVRTVSDKTVYDVLAPVWGDETYAKRTVATARLHSQDGKIVLKVTGYSPGWAIQNIQNGFDVYEQAPQTQSKVTPGS